MFSTCVLVRRAYARDDIIVSVKSNDLAEYTSQFVFTVHSLHCNTRSLQKQFSIKKHKKYS